MARIFISHSHSDEAIAYQLVNFLLASLRLKEIDILATSNPDQGLTYSSSSITDQLKNQLKNSEALIVLITVDSLHSAWIPFEAGSFWTTDKPIIPILGPSLTQNDLPGPLKSFLSIPIEAKDAEDRLNNAINQIAKSLNLQQELTRRRNYALQEFCNVLRAWKSKRPTTDSSQKEEIEKLNAKIKELNLSFDLELKRLFKDSKDSVLETYRGNKIQEILKSLYQNNRTTITEFPIVERDLIHKGITQKYDFLDLDFSEDLITIEVREKKRMNAFGEIWNKANSVLNQNKIEFFTTVDELTGLFCQSVYFDKLKHSENIENFHGTMIDASNPLFQLNIRSSFPLIYAYKTTFNEEDALKIRGLLNKFKIYADFFALLIVFSDHQQIRQQLHESPYKNDFIVLNHNQFWSILAAKSPIKQLIKYILEQIDLVAVSPYTVGGPVPEKMFFGREKEEKTLLQNIAQNDYALIANRKTGKTSLLNKIFPRLKDIPNFQVFYCDLQAVYDYESFFGELAISYPELEAEINQLNKLSPLDFRRVMGNIKQNNSNRQIIFIFDEVDELLAYDIQEKEKLFKTFRTLSQRENIRFIFSGTTTLVRRVRDPDSPFFNFCDLIKLELLEEKAARELITVPMKTLGVQFDNEAVIVQRILNLTARHPNIIQYICNALIEIINDKQERKIIEQDLDSVTTSQKFYEEFESLIWGQSSAVEKLIVYTMWSYPEFTESEVIEDFNKRGIAVEGVKASLEILLTYSTLSKKNDKYFFTFREFAKLMAKRSDIQALTKKYQQELEGVES